MQIIATELPEVKIIEPRIFGDERGFFFESYQQQRYQAAGIAIANGGENLLFIQDNLSRSCRGVLRGLHYQLRFPQGKLVTVVRGEVFDVAVDVRCGSPNFGKWIGVILSDQNHRQLYVPPGFAHGFYVLSEYADFHYKCTDYYRPDDECGVIWHDKEIGIEWPLTTATTAPTVSTKDAVFKPLAAIEREQLPQFVRPDAGVGTGGARKKGD